MKPLAVSLVRTGAVIELWVGDKSTATSIFDFRAVGYSEEVAESVARAFVALQGGNTSESQRANWRSTRRFGKFLVEQFGAIKKFPADSLARFGEHLNHSEGALRTKASDYNSAHRLLKWLLRNAPELVEKKIRLDRAQAASLAKAAAKPRGDALDKDLILQILHCCYEEIEAGEIEREKIRLLPLIETPDTLADVLLFLLSVGGGLLPAKQQLASVRGAYHARKVLASNHGLRDIYSQYYISTRELFPYYLSMLTQASANPQSFRLADKDCIVPVPFRDDLERLVWDKNRSRRSQAPDFPKSKTWSATNIARRLLAQNSEIRHLAPTPYRDALFLCRTAGMEVNVPSWQSLHNCLTDFRLKHGLPRFDFSDLRRTGAVLHHKAGRSIGGAQQRLQHRDARVTQSYTPLDDLSTFHQAKIRKFQGVMLQEARRFKKGPGVEGSEKKSPEASADTLFGFRCKDPLAGIAEGSRAGVPCPKFHQCAGCSGAIVVVDDPENIAKLIATSNHLRAERDRAIKEGWSKRFDSLYKPSMDILENDIFPAVSRLIFTKAKAIASLPLPRLE